MLQITAINYNLLKQNIFLCEFFCFKFIKLITLLSCFTRFLNELSFVRFGNYEMLTLFNQIHFQPILLLITTRRNYVDPLYVK